MAIIKLGVILWLSGSLARATFKLTVAAGGAQQQGLMSLTKLNRQLGM